MERRYLILPIEEGPEESPNPAPTQTHGLLSSWLSWIGLNFSSIDNPIQKYFDLGAEIGSAGPELVWRIYDARRKNDGKVCSVFMLYKRYTEEIGNETGSSSYLSDKLDKLMNKKKKVPSLDAFISGIEQLERMRHPKMLQIIHAVEENDETLAFASEPVMCSLQNILTYHDQKPVPNGHRRPVYPTPRRLESPTRLLPLDFDDIEDSNPEEDTCSTPRSRSRFRRASTSHSRASTAPPTPSKDEKFKDHAVDYTFLDIELQYGLLQIVKALQYLHLTSRLIHRNVIPSNIIVTKRGTWKLFGFEFVESVTNPNPMGARSAAPWSCKLPVIAQPCLDFLAPEIQTQGTISALSDLFSLGLVIITIFNNGKQILKSNNSPLLYMKQIEHLDHQVRLAVRRVPGPLKETTKRLLSKEPAFRPTTQLLTLIKYFKGPTELAIHAMAFMDGITMKDPQRKDHFYRVALIKAMPLIPKKIWWQYLWPSLRLELRTAELQPSVLLPVMWIINEASHEEFTIYVLPILKAIFRKRMIFSHCMTSQRSIPITLILLENLQIILKKTYKDVADNEIIPIVYLALETKNILVLTSALISTHTIADHIDDKALHKIIIPKLKIVLDNQSDVKIINLVLDIYEKILLRLERSHIIDYVIPSLLGLTMIDPTIINRVVKLYRSMLLEEKFGLTTNITASKMDSQSDNASLNSEQFGSLMEILSDMMDNIDKSQRHMLKLDKVDITANLERNPMRYQIGNDKVPAPPFNIPNLKVDRGRKVSSAEDMARKNSIGTPIITGPASASNSVSGLRRIGQWFFGSNNSTNDNNFLRVSSAYPSRRLSDNTMITPKIRIAPSCSSSPGGTPGAAELPARRHSSIGPQERRGSAVNLSPPPGRHQHRGRGGSGSSLSVPATSHTVGGSVPNTSSSVPFLMVRSRRPSVSGSQPGPVSGLLNQITSGVSRHLPRPSTSGASGASSAGHGSSPLRQLHWTTIQGATSAATNVLQQAEMAVRKCPSLNISSIR